MIAPTVALQHSAVTQQYKAPHLPAVGGYLDQAKPVVLIGDCGTGKTHRLTGLCVAACRQRRRVRFTTAAALVNEFVAAKHAMQPKMDVRFVEAAWRFRL